MSKRDGKVKFDFVDGQSGILCYDWEALAAIEDDEYLADKYQNLENHMRPKVLAKLLEIGFQRHSPDVTIGVIMKNSPPINYCFEKINEALLFAYFGNDVPADPVETEGKSGKKKTG